MKDEDKDEAPYVEHPGDFPSRDRSLRGEGW